MVIRLGRNGRFLACSLYPEHKETRPLPGRGAADAQDGEGETCPQCGEGTLVGKRGRFGPFVGCSRYPDCDYIKQDGPPPPDPLPFEVDLPQERRRPPRRASRAADRQRLLGVLRTTRSATSRRTTSRSARSTTPTTARSRASGEAGICLKCGATIDAARGRRVVGRRAAGRPAGPGGARAAGARGGGRRAARRRAAGGRGGPRRGGRSAARGRLAARRPRARERADRRDRPTGGRDRRRGRALDRFLAALEARDASPHTRRSYATAVSAYLDWLAERGADWRAPGRGDLRAYLARPRRRAARGRRSPSGSPRSARSTASRPAPASRRATRGARSRRRACRGACRACSRSTRSSGCSRSSTTTTRPTRTPRRGPTADPLAARSRCATGRSSRWRTPRASGSASSPRRTSGRSTCAVARCACSARAARSGSGCWAAGARGARRRTSTRRGRCSLARRGGPARADAEPTGRVFLNHHGAPLGVRGLRYRLDRLCRLAGLPEGVSPAHAAPLVRDPPARRRRGPAGRPGAAGPREPRDDAGLHARVAGPPARRLPRRPSPGAARDRRRRRRDGPRRARPGRRRPRPARAGSTTTRALARAGLIVTVVFLASRVLGYVRTSRSPRPCPTSASSTRSSRRSGSRTSCSSSSPPARCRRRSSRSSPGCSRPTRSPRLAGRVDRSRR